MDATSVDLILEGMSVPGWPEVYVLGCLDHRVTILSQQARALNLSAALVARGTCGPGDTVAVIGAGAAGLTLAAGLHRLGVGCVLLERRDDVLSIFRGGSRRWLHPGVYDWPEPGWHVDPAPLPLMSWSAGPVADVRTQLEAAWELARGAVETHLSVTGVAIAPTLNPEGTRTVSWNPGGAHRAVKAVVLAVGFGMERVPTASEARYWEADLLDGDPVDGQPCRWLVSGSGDGALTEVLRLCIRDFQHHRMVTDFASDVRLGPVMEEIRAIEADPTLATDAAVHARYAALDAPWVGAAMAARHRPTVRLTLNAPVDAFLNRSASPLNRFLVGQLHRIGAFDVVGGRIDRVDVLANGFDVTFAGGPGPTHRFDRMVRRHGPVPALDEDFPAIAAALATVRTERRRMRISLDRTRHPLWDEGAFGVEEPEPPPPPAPPAPRYRAVIVAADDVEPWVAAIDAALTRAGGTVQIPRTGPTDGRLEQVGAADVLVVVVGHRLGLADRDGDGTVVPFTARAVEAARTAGVPVVSAVVDDAAPWTERREEADVGTDDTDLATLVARVRALRTLRGSLAGALRFGAPGGAERPDELAAAVVAEVRSIADGEAVVAAGRPPWTPHEEHPLPIASNFQGRQRLMERLQRWWADPATEERVVALVAIGGAGKTAIARQLLQHAKAHPAGGGIFVWSFYENQKVEDFIRSACAYFCGPTGEGAGLWELKAALRSGDPHLLVLDGLELVQADDEEGRARGELLEVALRQLLQSVANGLGRTRVLATSRFRLVDLDPWAGAGAETEDIDDLDPAAARAILRGWGVVGSDDRVDALSDRVGRHALSVKVLGSFIGTVAGGDPDAAADLDLSVAGELDPHANRLRRLLLAYADAMSESERQVMARLSVFREGVDLELLADVLSAGAEGERPDEARLAVTVQSLVRRGLAFTYRHGADATFSAHPFVRDAFRALLDVPEQDIHVVAVERLRSGLEARPGSYPTDADELDRYEQLITHLIGLGDLDEAFQVFSTTVGGYAALGAIGEFDRCERMARQFPGLFDPDPPPDVPEGGLSLERRAILLAAMGLAALSRGDVRMAETCYRADEALSRRTRDQLSITLMNLASIARVQARLPLSVSRSAEAIELCSEEGRSDRAVLAAAEQGFALWAMGRLDEATQRFDDARQGGGLFSLSGLVRAETLLGAGDRDGAVLALETIVERATDRVPYDVARATVMLGRALLPGDPGEARRCLDAAQRWIAKTGDHEMRLSAGRLAAALAVADGDLRAAVAELDEAVQLADGGGYVLQALDLRLDRADIALARGDTVASQRDASKVLDVVTTAECGHVWAEARARHALGSALVARGSTLDRGRDHLLRARTLRRQLGDPLIEQTERALADLPD